MSSGLTVKERLERIDEIRSRINRAANLLSGHLDKLTTEASPENKEHIQRIKREIERARELQYEWVVLIHKIL